MLNDLKELDKFFKICRKQGVTDISFQGITVKFGDMPIKIDENDTSNDIIPNDSMTPEQLMFYAVEGQA